MGRCANWILRDNPYRFSTFIYASRSFRLKYAQATYNVPAKDIDTILPRVDNRREKFYNINTGGNWHDKGNYAMCLNTGILGIEGCAGIIVNAATSMPEPQE